MKRGTLVNVWAILFVAFLDRTLVLAQSENDVSELSIELRSRDLVDPRRLRDSLHDDLGSDVHIRLVSGDEPQASTHLIVEWAGTALIVLRLRRGDVERTREIEVGAADGERSAVLALLVANLLSDEADELIALLRARQRTEERDPAPEHREPIIEPLPAQDVDAQLEQGSPVDEEADPNAPVDVFVGLDLAPYVGMSSYFQGRDIRELSLGLVGVWSGEVRGASFSGAVGVTGRLRGLQLAGGLSLTQHGGAGLQIAGATSLTLEDFTGFQVAGASAVVLGQMRGVQISGALNIARRTAIGAQLAVANYASQLQGLQFGVLNLAGSIRGLQAGVANYANEVHGIQMGLLNVSSGYVHGLQIGLLNIADGADAGIGLLNIYRTGRTQVRIGMDTAGFLDASVIHGSRITHTIYSIRVNPVGGRGSGAFGIGIGARASISERVHLDFDMLSRALLSPMGDGVRSEAVLEPRVVLGVQLYKAVGLFAALAYPIRFSGAEAPTNYSRLTVVLREAGGSKTYVDAWPSLSLGIELL